MPPPHTIVAVQIGFKGRHYGLFKPAPVTAKPTAKPALKKPPSIFSLDDDEPLDMKAQLEKEMERKKKAKQVRLGGTRTLFSSLESIRSQACLSSSQAAEEQAKVLEDDPTAYDYDELYDNLKEKDTTRKSILEQEKKKRQVRRSSLSRSRVLIDIRQIPSSSLLTHAFCRLSFQPKYIKTLLEKAEHRKQEQEIVYERKLRKDREEEDHLYGDKDKFVTSSYKRKLVEQKKWQEEQEKKDAENQDVTKKKDAMFSFYANLLDRRNVAAGAEDDAKKREAERKAEEERKRREEEEAAERAQKQREAEDKRREQEQIEHSRELAREARRRSDAGEEERERHGRRDSREKDDRRSEKRRHEEKERRGGKAEAAAKQHEEEEEEEPEKKKRKGAVIDLPLLERPQAIREAPKRNDDSAVQAARERYLARKGLKP